MNNYGKHGFTLIELLVVITLIALLALLLVPMFRDAREHAHATICKKNMGEIAKGINSAPGQRPNPPEWRRFMMDRGMGSVLTCPSDDRDFEEPTTFPDLSDIYLVQKQGNETRISSVKVILETGSSNDDTQVTTTDSAHGTTAAEGQKIILIGSECAMILVTYGNTTKFESIIITDANHGCNSVHWLCIDDGSADWEDRIAAGLVGATPEGNDHPDPAIFVMHLQSAQKYMEKAPDYEAGFQDSSYAMSDAVANLVPRPGQLMVVEYSKDVAKVLKQEGFGNDNFGDNNEDETGFLRTRHFYLANFVTTDGSVRSMNRNDLQEEYDLYNEGDKKGLWAP